MVILNMNGMEEKIYNLLLPIAQSNGYGIVDMKIINYNSSTLQILLEKLDGSALTIDDCAVFSRQSSAVLDVEDPINGKYLLEVSSAGINRPLVKLEDFEKFKNQKVIIKTKITVLGKKTFSGMLLGINNEVVKIQVEGSEIEIDFNVIGKANLNIIESLNINTKEVKKNAKIK